MLVLEHSSTTAELQVGARMRTIARGAGADPQLADRAVAEALHILKRTGAVDVALNTGLAYVEAVKAERRAQQAPPTTWGEYAFWIGFAIAVVAILVASANGWFA